MKLLRKAALKLTGFRTIISAALLTIVRVAMQQGWIPESDESALVHMLEELLDVAWKVFLALKGNRILSGKTV